MKIVTIVGARPQFIKAAPVSSALKQAGHQEVLVHTGQHYDHLMSQVFFDELGIAPPAVNLQVGSGLHGEQTGKMLTLIEEILLKERPDRMLVYGDTNSTLAGAIAACKLRIPIAHVEAGLRSFNREMPEEHNRILTDHCSDILFCPTQTAVNHLAKEGITQGVHLVGDTMYDAVLQFSQMADERSSLLKQLELGPKQYLLATIHRPYNTDELEPLTSIITSLATAGEPVIFPAHPRTQQKINQDPLLTNLVAQAPHLRIIPPVGYLDMLALERNARLILTDSGGIQKEAFFLKVPCITLRPETEWVETVTLGCNVLVGSDRQAIAEAIRTHNWPTNQPAPVFGEGNAGQLIANIL